MNRQELLSRLKIINERQEKAFESNSYIRCENDHLEADELLLTYINDEEITEMFEAIERWYS